MKEESRYRNENLDIEMREIQEGITLSSNDSRDLIYFKSYNLVVCG